MGLFGLMATLTARCATNYVITLVGQSFNPSQLSIWAGDTVTFTNVSGYHNVVCQNYNPADPICGNSGNPQFSPWTYSFTYPAVGTFPFRCVIHSSDFTHGMVGAITVTAPSNQPPVVDQEAVLPNGAFQFRVTGTTGFQQVVEASPNLLLWTPVYTNQTGQPTFYYTNGPSQGRADFLRVIQR